MEQSVDNNVIVERNEEKQVGHAVYTTLPPETVWEHTGMLYVRKIHHKDDLSLSVRNQIKSTIPHIEDRVKSDWLCKIMEYGKSPILLTYKVSENTLDQSRLFGAVLAKETLHHTKTSDDMKRVFNNAKDTALRKEWKEHAAICPVFIKIWDAYPEVYNFLKEHCDHKTITLRYADHILAITIPALDKQFILEIETIKD